MDPATGGSNRAEQTNARTAANATTTVAHENRSHEAASSHSPSDYLQNAVFKAMAAGCFKPEYRDVALLTQTLWSCLHGLVALHAVRAKQAGVTWKPIQTIVDACLETLLNGMLATAYQTAATWQR